MSFGKTYNLSLFSIITTCILTIYIIHTCYNLGLWFFNNTEGSVYSLNSKISKNVICNTTYRMIKIKRTSQVTLGNTRALTRFLSSIASPIISLYKDIRNYFVPLSSVNHNRGKKIVPIVPIIGHFRGGVVTKLDIISRHVINSIKSFNFL